MKIILFISLFSSIIFGIDLTQDEIDYLKNKKELTVCVQPNWMPYEGIKNGKYVGISADYLNIISDKIGVPLKIITDKTNNKVVEKLKKTQCDIKPIATKGKGKLHYKATKANIDDYVALVTKVEQPFIDDLNKYLDKKYVVIKNRNRFINKIKKLYPQIKLVYANTIKESFDMVLNEKAFGIISKSKSLVYHTHKYYPSRLKVINEFHKISTGIGVSKDDKILFSIIEKALDSIDEKEEIKIRNNWEITTVEKKVDYSYLFYILAIGGLVILVILIRQYILSNINSNLKKQVEEKTKELQKINENLEKEVQRQVKSTTEILNKFKFASDNALAGFWEIDLKSNLLSFSDGWFEFLGYEKKDFEHITTQEVMKKIIHKDDFDKVSKNVEEFLSGKTDKYNTEFRILRKDGSYTWINALGTVYEDKFFGFHVNIEDLKNANNTLLEQSKHAALGDMIGNIAHQWRQPLSIITTTTSGMDIKKDIGELDDKYIDESIKTINKNIQYLSTTIDTFRNFIKGDKNLKYESLQDEISQGIDITSASLKNCFIKLIDNVDYENKIFTYISTGELTQVIINIINNAKDILIEKSITEPWIKIDLLKENGKVIISIEDNGGGIPEDILPKIFEPYFTTKHQSQGTGLGLHMSYRIVVESLNGKLWSKNTKNGAKFYIELPVK
jgi:PAS domain S-box-containing protein